MSKICTKCKISKDLDSFNNIKSLKDGKYPWCRDCKNEWMREYNKRPEVIARNKKWIKDKVKQNREFSNADKPNPIIDSKNNISKRKYKKTEKGIIARNKYFLNYRDDPIRREKQRARDNVCYAVRVGKLKRPEYCSICGMNNTTIEGHHHNGYDKKHQLDVVWVCQPCHRDLEKTETEGDA